MTNGNTGEFSIRVRFRLPRHDAFGAEEDRLILQTPLGKSISVSSREGNKPLGEAEWLVLHGSGWKSEAEAIADSELIADGLQRSLARLYTTADLGNRAPRSGFFPAGLELLEEKHGQRFVNDVHGAMVFPTNPRPLFADAGIMNARRTLKSKYWGAIFIKCLEEKYRLQPRERIAFDLYGVAHSVAPSVDARFVLLFSAFEALLEDSPRPPKVRNHVDYLIALTNESDIEDSEKEALLGSLRWLRSHSIRSNGRRLVNQRLAGREYCDEPAEKVFLDCYDMRNRLLHGSEPYPSRNEVNRVVGPMDQIVGDLLSGPLLDFEPA